MTLTFGGKALQPTSAPRQEAIVDAQTPDRVLLFLRLVALALEAREQLRDAVAALREIDVDALADPALADHPQRPLMLTELAEREADERAATVRVMEANASIARQWDAIGLAEKHRYALTWLVGEPDPDAKIGVRLWCDDRGLAALVPFPDDWSPHPDIAHRVFDDRAEITEHTYQEVLTREPTPF